MMRRRFALAALAVAAATAGCATQQPGAAARAALAPTGTLRIAVYPGSPTSLVENAAPDRMRGVSVDLGRALAARLGVPSQVQVYPRVAEVVAALQRGEADFTVTNASEARARLVDFAPPLLDLELGVLVPARSRVVSADAIDVPGAVIGVTQGSTSERTLAARLKQAKLHALPSMDAVRAALAAGEIDAFATNKAILFEQAARVPGARVLEGRWGAEHLAPAMPKGRDPAGLQALRRFTHDVRADGRLQRAVDRAGLKGTAAPS